MQLTGLELMGTTIKKQNKVSLLKKTIAMALILINLITSVQAWWQNGHLLGKLLNLVTLGFQLLEQLKTI